MRILPADVGLQEIIAISGMELATSGNSIYIYIHAYYIILYIELHRYYNIYIYYITYKVHFLRLPLPKGDIP